jgi:MoaA/NifB/PqqE/SkfB family radical SAM enzyme
MLKQAKKLKEFVVLGRMAWQVILAKMFLFPRPVTTNLQLTKVCNIDCDYCFADFDSLKKVRDPTTEELIETIDELYNFGCRHMILMGGEPLVRKDFGVIVDHIKSKWMRCEVVTNGYYVENHLDALRKCDSICLSLDGDKESNDQNREEGCFDAVMNAIEIFVENGIKFRIHSVLTKYNIKTGLKFIAPMAKKYSLPFNFSMIMLRPEKRPDYINLSEEDIQEFLKEYRQFRDDDYPVYTSDAAFDYMEKWPKPGNSTIFHSDNLTPEQMKNVMPCNYGLYNASVDTDGKVYKCAVTWKNGLDWRKDGMKAALGHIGQNLINCISCRSIGDIDRAILLRFRSLDNIKMVFKYITRSVSKKIGKVAS